LKTGITQNEQVILSLHNLFMEGTEIDIVYVEEIPLLRSGKRKIILKN